MIYIKLTEEQKKEMLFILDKEKRRTQLHYNILENPNHKKELLEEISKISDLIKAVK